MRTGRQYREALKDGREVWVLGEGRVDDLSSHPSTRAMVDAYAAWYDRHQDPAWRDILLTPADAGGERRPRAFEIPRGSDDLRRLGEAISKVAFLSGGNVTHTPGYGALIALGLLDTLQAMGLSAAEVANASTYRDELARTGRFLTFSAGGATIGLRFREAEADRAAIRVVRERDDGLVVSGKVGMHTASPFADDVFVSGATRRTAESEHFNWFIIPVAARGVRVVARKSAARHADPAVAPLSHAYDELDAQLWLDEVFIPFERVFTAETPLGSGRSAGKDGAPARDSNLVAWLLWHQLHGWLAKLEFGLGLGLAASDVMGFRANPAAVEQLIDMVVEVQTIRTCLTAAECDPDVSESGFLLPRQVHLASGSLHALGVRQKMTETLRRLPGSSLVVAPSPGDFADPDMAAGLGEAFGGGGYTAEQRAALLNLIWDHVSSGLDGRESAYELHANGGVPAWRMRLRGWFKDYDGLANGVLQCLAIDMPHIRVSGVAQPSGPRPAVPGGPVAPSASIQATEGPGGRPGEWVGPPAKG
jgi:4-hydroxyphenylacetate 3-monooxygenase